MPTETHEQPARDLPPLERLLTTAELMTAYGCGPTKLYEILPQLDVRKLGRRTVATESSVRRHMASLPKAALGAGQSVASRGRAE